MEKTTTTTTAIATITSMKRNKTFELLLARLSFRRTKNKKHEKLTCIIAKCVEKRRNGFYR